MKTEPDQTALTAQFDPNSYYQQNFDPNMAMFQQQQQVANPTATTLSETLQQQQPTPTAAQTALNQASTQSYDPVSSSSTVAQTLNNTGVMTNNGILQQQPEIQHNGVQAGIQQNNNATEITNEQQQQIIASQMQQQQQILSQGGEGNTAANQSGEQVNSQANNTTDNTNGVQQYQY